MKKNLLITILLIIPASIYARFTSLRYNRHNIERRDCILYDNPSKEICDTKFPDRMTAEEYIQLNIDIVLGWLIMMSGILFISFTCCDII